MAVRTDVWFGARHRTLDQVLNSVECESLREARRKNMCVLAHESASDTVCVRLFRAPKFSARHVCALSARSCATQNDARHASPKKKSNVFFCAGRRRAAARARSESADERLAARKRDIAKNACFQGRFCIFSKSSRPRTTRASALITFCTDCARRTRACIFSRAQQKKWVAEFF